MRVKTFAISVTFELSISLVICLYFPLSKNLCFLQQHTLDVEH